MTEESGEFDMEEMGESGEEELSEEVSDDEDEVSSKAKHDKQSKGKKKGEDEEEMSPERKKAIEKAMKQYDYMHASSLEGDDSDMDEMGELEMEEGEYEWEEVESEMELPEGVEAVDVSADSDEDDDEPPQLVPIKDKKAPKEEKKKPTVNFKKAETVLVKRTRKEAELPESIDEDSDSSDGAQFWEDQLLKVNPNARESSLDSDIDTSELEDLEAEQMGDNGNNHGFVYADGLNTYRMNKAEKKEAKAKEKETQEKK